MSRQERVIDARGIFDVKDKPGEARPGGRSPRSGVQRISPVVSSIAIEDEFVDAWRKESTPAPRKDSRSYERRRGWRRRGEAGTGGRAPGRERVIFFQLAVRRRRCLRSPAGRGPGAGRRPVRFSAAGVSRKVSLVKDGRRSSGTTPGRAWTGVCGRPSWWRRRISSTVGAAERLAAGQHEVPEHAARVEVGGGESVRRGLGAPGRGRAAGRRRAVPAAGGGRGPKSVSFSSRESRMDDVCAL